MIDFPADYNSSNLFKSKQKMTGKINNNGIKDVEIMAPLKYLNNFWRTLEMPLINWEISLMLTWSKNCFLIASALENQNPTLEITDAKLSVPAVALSTLDNVKLLKQLESGFKRTFNQNKYQSKVTHKTLNIN